MILALKNALSQSVFEDALIITATRRLAKQWQPILVSQEVNVSPRMLSQTEWLTQLWTLLESAGLSGSLYLLSPTQESVLWKKIIESSTEGQRLLRVHATAKKVAQAFGLLKQWDIALEEVCAGLGMLTEETHLFLQWANEFNQILSKKAWIVQADLPNVIIQCLGDKHWGVLESYSVSKKIKLLGFEDIPPQFKTFYTKLKLKNWEVTELHETDFNAQARPQHHKYAFYDQSEELRAAALWAHSLKTQVDYAGAIGIVVPDLAQCRSQVVHIFTEILEPLSELQPEQRVSDQFNISVAKPLSSYPIIFSALKALTLLKIEKLDEEQSLFFKRSPFFSSPETSFLSQSTFIYLKQNLPFKTTLIHWAQIFEQCLKLMGWPGTRRLNSIEHQAMARWQLLLEEFAALESVLDRQEVSSAIQYLVELANETPFQGQSKPAPIHIMGILEASSQPFEYLWVTGLHNEAWPPIPQANPFLPIALQRKNNMPHASSEREYAFSKKLLENLKQACGCVIMSYYKNDRVKSYYPSHLISDLVEEQIKFEFDAIPHPATQNKVQLESLVDDKAPVLQDGSRCRGGTNLFQAQAACPFKAFAQYRLKAVPKNKPSIGLSAQERGILVHKILEQLWAVLKSSDELCAFSEERVDELLEKTIDENIGQIRWRYTQLADFFWEVEHQRLKTILLVWLNLEKKRPAFKVLAQEEKQVFYLAGLRWELKIDRIDQDENKNIIIIDYKTSDQKLVDCLTPRLQAPQLPLYCISATTEPKAVAFGQLQAQHCKFVGLSESEGMIPGVKEQADWGQLLIDWKASLESLALEFKNGEAPVQPYKGEQNCRNCHLLQLCRIKSLNDE